MTIKDEFRIALKSERQAFVKRPGIQEIFDRNAACVDHLFARGTLIAGYVSFGSEVSPAAMLAAVEARGAVLALPHIGTRGAAMTFKAWDCAAPLHRAAFGFEQPADERDDVAPNIILVPLVGFDREMHRLGHGAGHYDRIFSIYNNALRVGLAWSCQERSLIPTDRWDVALDGVLTEKEWIVGTNTRIAA
jgi:5-formyltetrahydrofolate cyclo-ligase